MWFTFVLEVQSGLQIKWLLLLADKPTKIRHRDKKYHSYINVICTQGAQKILFAVKKQIQIIKKNYLTKTNATKKESFSLYITMNIKLYYPMDVTQIVMTFQNL
jgi:hypothetical protein